MKKQIAIPAGCFALISVAVLLLPFSGSGETGLQRGMGYAVGVLFWAGLIGGIAVYVIMNRKYRAFLADSPGRNRIPGVFRFFRNRAAVVVDCVLIISLLCVIAGAAWQSLGMAADLIFLFLLVTSVYLHVLVNGNLFAYILDTGKTEEKEKRKDEEEKEIQ